MSIVSTGVSKWLVCRATPSRDQHQWKALGLVTWAANLPEEGLIPVVLTRTGVDALVREVTSMLKVVHEEIESLENGAGWAGR